MVVARRKVAPPHGAELYNYSVRWSEEDGVFVGRVAEFPSLAAHGPTLEAALREIKFVVSDVIADLAESGEPIPEPFSKRRFSGKFVVRVPEALHRELAIRASGEGVSLNQLVNSKLEK
jgi:predicted HicB family RNase H-like nuclease